MEEDAGKMVHIGGGEGRIAGATHSLVDYNRAGTPLIELVTEPELRTPEEARLFMQKLRQIYLALGISDCSLEEGGAIYQETRHWDPSAKRTIVMRVKETADDYRLCPEPDMAPFDLSDEFIENVRAKLPELPDQKAARFEADFGLSAYDARHLVEHRAIAAFFEAGMAAAGDAHLAKPLANLAINDIAARMNADESFDLAASPLTPGRAVELVKLAADDVISSKQAKEVFAAVIEEDADPAAIVEKRGMKQVSDTGAIEAVVDAVIAANPDEVARYRGGEAKLIGFFVGQCMKQMRGQGNPKMINQMLAKKLG